MRYMFHVIFLLIISCFQGTVSSFLSVYNIEINFFIIYISIISLLGNKKESVIVAGIFGLVLDLLISRFIGFYVILFIICAFLVNSMSEKVFKEPSAYICALVVLFVSFFVNVFYYLMAFIIIEKMNFLYTLLRIIVPEIIYNSIVSVFAFLLIKRITKNLYKNKGEYFD